jgi:hypothetical protein
MASSGHKSVQRDALRERIKIAGRRNRRMQGDDLRANQQEIQRMEQELEELEGIDSERAEVSASQPGPSSVSKGKSSKRQKPKTSKPSKKQKRAQMDLRDDDGVMADGAPPDPPRTQRSKRKRGQVSEEDEDAGRAGPSSNGATSASSNATANTTLWVPQTTSPALHSSLSPSFLDRIGALRVVDGGDLWDAVVLWVEELSVV